jgi:hypothetical protein
MANILPTPRYSVNLSMDGENITIPLQFDLSDASTKKGVNMQFVLPKEKIQDPRKKQEYANKISVALQKRFGEAGIPVDYNERNAYLNVVSFIIPLSAISGWLIKTLKGE